MKHITPTIIVLTVSITLVYFYLKDLWEIIDTRNPNVKIIEPSGCYSENKNISEIYVENRKIIIKQSIVTGNPCYYLDAEFDKLDNKINVFLTPLSKGGTCVMCVGVVTGEIEISPSPEEYKISVFSKRKEKVELLNEKTVVIE